MLQRLWVISIRVATTCYRDCLASIYVCLCFLGLFLSIAHAQVDSSIQPSLFDDGRINSADDTRSIRGTKNQALLQVEACKARENLLLEQQEVLVERLARARQSLRAKGKSSELEICLRERGEFAEELTAAAIDRRALKQCRQAVERQAGLETRCKVFETKHQELVEENRELREKLDSSVTEAQVRKQLETVREIAESKADELKGQQRRLLALVKRKKEQVAELEASLSAETKENKRIRQKLKSLEQGQEKQRLDVVRRGEEIAQLNQKYQAALGTIRELKSIQPQLEQLMEKEQVFEEKARELSISQSNLEQTIRENSSLKRKLDIAENEIKRIAQEKQEISKSSAEELEKLREASERLERERNNSSEELGELRAKLASEESQRTILSKALEARENEVGELKKEIQDLRALEIQLEDVNRQLVEARNLVMLRETELRHLTGEVPVTKPAPATRPIQTKPEAKSSPTLIVEVIKDKVNLRAGPGREHAPIMQVSKGTRLVVEERKGDWLRVITPTESRAYVVNSVVKPYGRKTAVSKTPSNVVPFGDVSLDNEATKAFRRLRQGLGED